MPQEVNTQFARAEYTSTLTTDRVAGFTALKLSRTRSGVQRVVAEVAFWDAQGQFFAQTFEEVPLQILEALVAEARKQILVG